MPFRLDDFRAKIQFITMARMPNLVYQACVATGTVSNTRYIQEAVCQRLAQDLKIPLADLLAELDTACPPRGNAAVLFGNDRKPVPQRGRHFVDERVHE